MSARALKLVGVMGSGLVGTDPYAPQSWSGSSRYFFRECERRDLLHRAFGVEVPQALRIPLMLRNFSFDRDLWRGRFYLDTGYYAALSRRIVSQMRPDDRSHGVLQIGGIYDLRPLLGADRPIFSYHDGNLAQAVRSPHFVRNLAPSTVQRALNYERGVYHGIDVIFAMSEYLRASFVNDFGVDERKVCVIGAGINLDALPDAPEGKDYDTKRLLFIGADFERKGGRQLLQAFRAVRAVHPQATLVIIGPRQLSIPPGEEAGVEYLGFLSRKDPVQKRQFDAAVAQSSLFVMPSLYEPFGIAPLEAMAYEIPAVLTNAWAFPEMVVPGVNGELVETGDVNGLAEKLIELLKRPDQLRAMGRAGRERVMSRFTWEAVVEKLRATVAAAR